MFAIGAFKHTFCCNGPELLACPIPTEIVPVSCDSGAQPLLLTVYSYVPETVGIPDITYWLPITVPVLIPTGGVFTPAVALPTIEFHVVNGSVVPA